MSRVPGTFSGGRRVKTLFVLPSPDTPGLTVGEQLALTVRRDATLSGRCACGATRPAVKIRRGRARDVAMEHERDCPAVSATLDVLVRRLGRALEYEAITVELEVAA